ncbi:MAG: putative membrane protein YqgA involved in biofilm formation, partial [Flavobacteriales bacterium]
MIIPIGSIVNALAVIIGSLIGLKFGSLVSPKIKTAIFQVIGLFTLVLGLKMALATQEFLLLLICLVLGAIIGEALSIDKSLTSLGDFLKDKLKSKNPNFTEGLLTAFLLYCVGSMTFVGAIEEGINQDTTLLFTKS